MKNMATTLTATLVLVCATCDAREPSGASYQPVEIEGEPMHSIRLVNSVVRVYEAVIPPGADTLFHTHRNSGVGIDMTTARLYIDKIGAAPLDDAGKAGEIFPVNASVPYAHLVRNVDEVSYRVIVAELLQTTGASPDNSTINETKGYKLELENALVRAYRLVLQPGESTILHTLAMNTLNVSVSGGQLSITSGQGNPRLVSLAPGALEWNSAPVTNAIRNVGVSTYEAVHLEWKLSKQ